MNDILIIAIGCVIGASIAGVWWYRRRPQKIPVAYFQAKWREMQKLCGNKDTWQQAIMDADKLLDEALKKRRFGGKTMGERLTKAQRIFTNNEGVWFGHKLRNKIHDDPGTKLKESEVKQALIGIRQGLKDLGAFAEAGSETPTKESSK